MLRLKVLLLSAHSLLCYPVFVPLVRTRTMLFSRLSLSGAACALNTSRGAIHFIVHQNSRWFPSRALGAALVFPTTVLQLPAQPLELRKCSVWRMHE